MSRLLMAALAAFVLAGSAPAQTLAHSVTADTLLYVRSHSGDPIDAMKKMLSGGGLWNEPVDLDAMIDMMDQGMAQAGEMLDMGNISFGKWLRSIRGYEAALTRFVPLDGWAEFDFVIVMETTMADEIYDVVSGKLIEEAMADEVSKDEMEMGFGEFSMNVGKFKDMIIFASDSRQLRETMKSFGSVKPGCLAQSKKFKRAIGSDDVPDYCVYSNLTPWLAIAREELDARVDSMGPMASFPLAATALGAFKLGAVGWTELPDRSYMAITADEPIPAFDILAAGKGGKAGLETMPSDVIAAMAWNGSGKALWEKGTGFLLDENKFPMAALFRERMIQGQKRMGIKMADIMSIATGGISMAFMADSDGKINNGEENFFVAMRTSDPDGAADTIADLLTKVLEPRGSSFESSEEGGRLWYRIKMDDARFTPCMAFDGDTIVMGSEFSCRKAMDARSGNRPTLARYGVGKNLPQQASAYMYVSLKAIMAGENDFAPAYANLRDGAGIAAAVNIDPDRIEVRTSMPVTHMFGAFGAASAMYESQRKARTQVLGDLKKIAEAYREYRATNDRDPKTLGQLGFTGENALSYPPGRPAGQPGKPYKLVSTEGANTADGYQWGVIVVICPDNKFGRLVGTFDGKSRSLSEERFQRAFKRQAYPK